MSNETERAINFKEALQTLKSRIEDFKRFNKLSPDWEDNPTKEDQKTLDDLGSPYDYGLSLEKESYNYRSELVTWRYVLSTGGPHDEFEFQADKNGSIERDSIKFVFLPWFDRIEKPLSDFSEEDQTAVINFLGNWLYLEIYDEQ
jgi:hypothetical protein